ncbi:MAG: hypothetical protein ACRESC_08815, partial [Gammaproteobacteria bacterium]
EPSLDKWIQVPVQIGEITSRANYATLVRAILDGRVASGLMPREWARVYDRIEPYGFFILVGLIVFNILGFILWPPVSALLGALAAVAGLGVNEFSALLGMLM